MARRVEAIDDVVARLPDEQQRLVRVWYWDRRRPSPQRVADELAVSLSTVHLWRRGILLALAVRLGWTHVA